MDRIKGKDGNWRPSEPISTYGGLVDFLSLFPREHPSRLVMPRVSQGRISWSK
jgi:hypothetical protein